MLDDCTCGSAWGEIVEPQRGARAATRARPGRRPQRTPRRGEAEAAVRTLLRWAGVAMVTRRLLGAFRDDPTTRREFFALVGAGAGQMRG